MLDLNKILKNIEKTEKSSGLSPGIESIIIEEKGIIQQHFFKPDHLHQIRSISKVVIALAIGVAINKKMLVNGSPLSVETHVYPVFSKLNIKIEKENLSKIKKWQIKHLLTYSCGYSNQMFSEKERKYIKEENYVEYCLNHKIEYEAGEKAVYNNAEAFLLSVFFQEAFGQNIEAFINEEIFLPLGIKKYKWENGEGNNKYCIGATGLCLSNTDMFKIGKLILNKGNYNGKQIVSQKYIEEMCKIQIATPSTAKLENALPRPGIGYVLRVSRDGYVFKLGSKAQYLIINLEKERVIAVQSNEKEVYLVEKILEDSI